MIGTHELLSQLIGVAAAPPPISSLEVKGGDTITRILVNNAFVMRVSKENLGVSNEVMLLLDGNGWFTRAIGCELDSSDKPVGLGKRSGRFALLAEDGVVKVLNREEGGASTFSGADDILNVMQMFKCFLSSGFKFGVER
ncbi:hypothetical protein NL676_039591 [Syzygium grande]|nr:hypothetical protein NL676_039591 [Syzygium grande]